MRANLTLTP